MAYACEPSQTRRDVQQSTKTVTGKPATNLGNSDDPAVADFHQLSAQAVPTGFEPAVSSLTGTHVRPLHHGTRRKLDCIRLASYPANRALGGVQGFDQSFLTQRQC